MLHIFITSTSSISLLNFVDISANHNTVRRCCTFSPFLLCVQCFRLWHGKYELRRHLQLAERSHWGHPELQRPQPRGHEWSAPTAGRRGGEQRRQEEFCMCWSKPIWNHESCIKTLMIQRNTCAIMNSVFCFTCHCMWCFLTRLRGKRKHWQMIAWAVRICIYCHGVEEWE